MSGYNFEFKGLGGAECIATHLTCYLTAAHAKVARERARRAGRDFQRGSFICRACRCYHNKPLGYVPEPDEPGPHPEPEPTPFEWPAIGLGKKNRVVCVDTGKLCFDSEESAAAERKRTRRQGSVNERSIRSYLCPHCELWHNTSSEAWAT